VQEAKYKPVASNFRNFFTQNQKNKKTKIVNPATIIPDPAKKMSQNVVSNRGEVLTFKSPAEFFAENRQIAGFDNPGKCLFTTLREFVENGLDAAEAIDALPEIHIRIEEFTREELNALTGLFCFLFLFFALFPMNRIP
jgi:hypothetical protein